MGHAIRKAKQLESLPPSGRELFLLPAPTKRAPWLDCLRGLAVIAMMLFHLSFDLHHFAGERFQFSPPTWYWQLVPSIIGAIFLTCLGIAAQLRFEKEGKSSFANFHRRALTIGGLALGINFATFYFTPTTPIYFGILHCAAAAFFVLPWILGNSARAARIGAILFLSGAILQNFRFETRALLWLGFMPKQNAGWDYYPLLPWLGVVLLGAALGARLRNSSQLQLSLFSRKECLPVLWLGKNSLLVYLVHQPVLLALLWACGFAKF